MVSVCMCPSARPQRTSTPTSRHLGQEACGMICRRTQIHQNAKRQPPSTSGKVADSGKLSICYLPLALLKHNFTQFSNLVLNSPAHPFHPHPLFWAEQQNYNYDREGRKHYCQEHKKTQKNNYNINETYVHVYTTRSYKNFEVDLVD